MELKVGLSEQKTQSTSKAREMTISADKDAIVFQIFTKSIYSNPIGSVVREITSNCFDSHIEAGVDSPVVIRKNTHEEGISISFIDYGVGMSPDRIYKIYGSYFESTKRADNTQIGGFGIGGKTPLAYKRSTGYGEGEYDNSFFIITTFEGVKYTYCVYEGEKAPIISPLHEEKTSDHNGTEIRVPVLKKDMQTFQREMKKQLYYFENVIFEGFHETRYDDTVITDSDGNPVSAIPNEYQIIRGKNFLYRGSTYNSAMHICLGRVAYPIDYDTLGLSSRDYDLPVAVKLEVGDLNVTASRESIDYSEKTIKMLKKKLEQVKAEIIEMIGKQYSGIQSLKDYFTVKNNFGKLEFPNGTSLDVSSIIKQKDVDFSNFKYGFMKMPNDKQLFHLFFYGKMYGKKPARSRWSDNDTSFKGGYDDIQRRGDLLYVEGEFKRKVIKQAYLREEHESYYIITKNKIDYAHKVASLSELFNVHLDSVLDDKGNPVPFVQSLLEMQDEYWEIIKANAEDYDELEVPEYFIANRKRGAGITPELRKTTIVVDFIGGGKQRVKMSTLIDYKMPIFYGTADDDLTLDRAKELYVSLWNRPIATSVSYDGTINTNRYRSDNKEIASMMFIQLAKNNVKHMAHCQKAYHVSQFKAMYMHRKEAMVRKYFQTNELVEKYNSLDSFYCNSDSILSLISPKWDKVMSDIRTFIEALPEQSRADNMYYLKSVLREHYGLKDIKMTGEQKMMMKKMEKIQKLHKDNETILNYISMPYNATKDNVKPELIDILKKVMVL